MIIQENVTINSQNLIHTYSDKKVYIHGGNPIGDYSEAYDKYKYTYTETNIPIVEEKEDTNVNILTNKG